MAKALFYYVYLKITLHTVIDSESNSSQLCSKPNGLENFIYVTWNRLNYRPTIKSSLSHAL